MLKRKAPGITDIFKMQQLLYDEKDQKKITRSLISVGGIGGIGSFAAEFLIRNGFINLNIADNDIYEKHNARQLYMTSKTIGKKKALVAKKRLLDIYPEANINVFSDGINQSNYSVFCEKADVDCAQTDRITSQILLYMGTFEHRSVLIHAGRASWPDKHLVTMNVYDYRKGQGKFNLDMLNINPRQWRVDNISLIYDLIKSTKAGKEDEELVETIDKQNREFRKKSFIKSIKYRDVSSLSEKSRDYLLKVSKLNPDDFYKMAITPELCSISAALIVTTLKDIILDRQVKRMAIDLFHGKLIENYKDL